MSPAPRPRSAVGEALLLHQEAVDHCESLYLTAQGEVTEESEQAEAARDLTARQALEALARYERWLDERERTAEAERESLARYEAATTRRRQWADEQIAALAETVAPGRTRVELGTRVIKLRHTTAVVTDRTLDLATVPARWLREVPEKITPATVALDKNEAKADMLLGFREGPPPGPGWYAVENLGRCRLEQRDGVWWVEPAGQPARPLSAEGMAIEAVPGMDQLRWRPAPEGVALEYRTHVKVG